MTHEQTHSFDSLTPEMMAALREEMLKSTANTMAGLCEDVHANTTIELAQGDIGDRIKSTFSDLPMGAVRAKAIFDDPATRNRVISANLICIAHPMDKNRESLGEANQLALEVEEYMKKKFGNQAMIYEYSSRLKKSDFSGISIGVGGDTSCVVRRDRQLGAIFVDDDIWSLTKRSLALVNMQYINDNSIKLDPLPTPFMGDIALSSTGHADAFSMENAQNNYDELLEKSTKSRLSDFWSMLLEAGKDRGVFNGDTTKIPGRFYVNNTDSKRVLTKDMIDRPGEKVPGMRVLDTTVFAYKVDPAAELWGNLS